MKTFTKIIPLLLLGVLFLSSCTKEESNRDNSDSKEEIQKRSCWDQLPCPEVFDLKRDNFGNFVLTLILPIELDRLCPTTPPSRILRLASYGHPFIDAAVENVTSDNIYNYIQFNPIPSYLVEGDVLCVVFECGPVYDYIEAMCPGDCPTCIPAK